MSGLALEVYCSQLEALLERQHTDAALIEKQRAELAESKARDAMLQAQDAMLQAQAADRAKATFLANMSHELRTPLNAIIGFSEMIKLKIGAPSPEYADCILEASNHLLTIINDILDLARINAGKIELDEEVVSIRELMSGSIRAIQPLAEKKSIIILYAPESVQEEVLGDPAKLKQIFINFLSNGIKFTPRGGQIAVASRRSDDGDLVISFTDTGNGIPAEQLAVVLEPFEQTENHMSRENEGAGLGLPIARALARLHGGDIVLRSEVGVGTTAEMHLPGDRVRAGALVPNQIDLPNLPAISANSLEGQPPREPAAG